MSKKKKTKLEIVCRCLCKQDHGDPNERVNYGNGWRWLDYHIEARQILRTLARGDR